MSRGLCRQETAAIAWDEGVTQHRERMRHAEVSETTPLTDKSLEDGLKGLVDEGWVGKAYISTSSSSLRGGMGRRQRFTLNFPLGGCLCLLARQTTLFLSRTFISSSKENRSYRQLSVFKLLAITIVSLPLLLLAMVLAYGGLPPSYHAVRLHERALPQHDWTRGNIVYIRHSGGEKIDLPRGDDSKYIRFPDHLWGHGLNNVLQEALLQALIAHSTNRTYVFEDFVWSHLPLPYTLYDFSLRPTRVPMGAFLGGWIAGEGGENSFASIQRPNHGRKTDSEDVDGGKKRGEQQARMRRNGPLTGHASDRGSNFWSPSLAAPAGSSTSPPTATSRFSRIVDSRDETINSNFTHGHETSVPDLQRDDIQGVNNSRVSISAEYFEHICPPSQRVEVVYRWPWDPFSEDSPEETADGLDILQWWITRLSQDDLKDEKCVVIREEERRVWDSNFFGTKRPLSLFPLLRDSPILKHFRWSDIVETAVERNINTQFSDIEPNDSILYSKKRSSAAETPGHDNQFSYDFATSAENPRVSSSGVVPGLVAIHLRRGDYKRHCTRLAQWRSGYMGWNRLVDGLDGENNFDKDLFAHLNLADVVLALDGSPDERTTKPVGVVEEDDDTLQDDANDADVEAQSHRREEFYLAHCLPTIPQVVARLRQVRDEYAARLAADSERAATSRMGNPLTQVYVLTNGWPSFLESLRKALLADGWDKVVGSVDLETGLAGRGVGSEDDAPGFTREEKGVSAAIDMGIAERAEVFLGNGFSSLSANIVMLRLAKGFSLYSNILL